MTRSDTVRTPTVDKNGKLTHVHRKVASPAKGIRAIGKTPPMLVDNVLEGAASRAQELAAMEAELEARLKELSSEQDMLESKKRHPSATPESIEAAVRREEKLHDEKYEALDALELVMAERRCVGIYDFYTAPRLNDPSFGLNFIGGQASDIVFLEEGLNIDGVRFSNNDLEALNNFFVTGESTITPNKKSEIVARIDEMEAAVEAMGRHNKDAIALAKESLDSDNPLDTAFATEFLSGHNAQFRTEIQNVNYELVNVRTQVTAIQRGYDYAAAGTYGGSDSNRPGIGFKFESGGGATLGIFRSGKIVAEFAMDKDELIQFQNVLKNRFSE